MAELDGFELSAPLIQRENRSDFFEFAISPGVTTKVLVRELSKLIKAVQEAGTTGSNPVRESLLPGDDRSIVGDTYMVRSGRKAFSDMGMSDPRPVVDGVAGEKTMVFFL